MVLQHPANTSRRAADIATPTLGPGQVIFQHLTVLRAHERQRRWLWLLQRDFEWDAAASLLSLSISTPEAGQDASAWQAVEDFFQRWAHYAARLGLDKRWQLLERLYRAAQRAKEGDVMEAIPTGKCRYLSTCYCTCMAPLYSL